MTIKETIASRAIKAKRPNHIWHMDLTNVQTTAGFWVPWIPFSKLQRRPFCWWVLFGAVGKHASIAVLERFSDERLGGLLRSYRRVA